ncbi:AMP-binding protein [Paenibacillus sp. CF384]|uniref:AMP-binding protein n=1 Tax=Paenibacillus sp. CF384 TaxID=1884382 RepID=UPI00089A153C|nr:AMP-binding protein [Paenibacillus sp. CF384]SDW14216.1 acetyl-CoA synthetase [Paenibacillus sp. CF384]
MRQRAVWFPKQSEQDQTRLYQFMLKHGFTDYEAFYSKSIEDVSWFWDAVVQDMGIEWAIPYDKVVDFAAGLQWPSWFTQGQLNIAVNAVDRWLSDPQAAGRNAMIWESEDQQTLSFTYAELAEQVNRAAHGLRQQFGLSAGERVALYMPMIPETVIAMLALAKLGAVAVPIYSGYSAEAVAKRIDGSGCTLLITADGYYRRGKPIHMKEEADKAADAAASHVKLVVVRRLGIPVSKRKQAGEVDWFELMGAENSDESTPFPAAAMNSSDPLMLLYTSGTTGSPKGIVHTHSGFPIKAAFDAGYVMDFRPGDTMLWNTDMGWMMGPFMVYGTLLNGGTMVLYDGAPDFPGPSRIFNLVNKHKVTHLGISPTLIRSLMKHGEACYNGCDLTSLRVIGSSGEPWNPEPWQWLFHDIGQGRIPIVNYSGGTEISGGILGNVLLKPIAPAGFNAAIPGMHADVFSQEGKPVRGEVGELVLKNVWLGMAGGFWQEPERYENTYWSRWPDIWVHGDWVELDDDGFWTITGRSDDTLNVAGKRLGPTEMESLLAQHPRVVEAAAVGVPDDLKGEAAVCFVVLDHPPLHPKESTAIISELFEWVTSRLGKAFKPSAIHILDALPKTRNAKVMRRVIRSAYLAIDPGDLSALENLDSLEAIRKLRGQGNSNSLHDSS